MKKRKVTFLELVERNKEELLQNKEQLLKLEQRLDARYASQTTKK